VNYAINVTSASDVAAGIKFAKNNNIRLVIKNTGHDFLGRSTGAGSLSLWTHYLKDLTFLDSYQSEVYRGPAVRMGAGVQGYELLEGARSHGRRVITGSCSGVGVAGGYTQGGGHSMLASTYGLAADNVLEWEVLTATGDHLTATPTQNEDLYWALSGGGGGTYGVVLSVTMKTYPDGPVAGGQIVLSPTNTATNETFWQAVQKFQTHVGSWVDQGAVVVSTLRDGRFQLYPFTLPDRSAADVRQMMKAWTDELDQLGMPYDIDVTEFDSYYEHYVNYFGPLPFGIFWFAQVQGGRMIPRDLIETSSGLGSLVDLYRYIVSKGYIITANGVNLAKFAQHTSPTGNAANPAWRKALQSVLVLTPWDWNSTWAQNVAELEDPIRNDIDPKLVQLTPTSGTYANEADPFLASWKQSFFGGNYKRLTTIKKKYDPTDLFYVTKGAGSEAWTVSSRGQLCRAS
jgi:hypothetical protein